VIDLHTHSSASDGALSPAALIAEARRIGISTLALTDHDTLDGLAEAARAAATEGIRFVPGIELEIKGLGADYPHPTSPRGRGELNWPSGEFHLLGLGLTHPDSEFRQALAELAQWRKERNALMIQRLGELGVSVSLDEVEALAGGEIIGRPHFAALLVQRRVVRNVEQAFARYLGRGQAAYIPKKGLPFVEAAGHIHRAGGLAVLAHPKSLYLSWRKLPNFISLLARYGLDGVEAWHPNATLRYCRHLEETARRYRLLASAGSDFHGKARPGRRLGYSAGGRSIDSRGGILAGSALLRRLGFEEPVEEEK
jgi:predicted metal-dependent phosphoesterase TrpH